MLPELFCKRMREMLGENYDAFLASYEREKCQALRFNPLKRSAEGTYVKGTKRAADCFAAMAGQEKQAAPSSPVPVPWAEDGYYYEKELQPGRHPYHQAGLYYIQEPSAMAPAALLDAQPGERILDLCAAPGGKSTQIAAALRGQGILVCNEIHPARAKILSENIERMGVRNACVVNETPERLADVFLEYFDRILVDAPCSGEGMFRKNEEACGEWSPENVALCADRQDAILSCAARMLRPGGRLVYSTCTFAPQENEGSVSRFIAAHPEFRILPAGSVKRALREKAGRPGTADVSGGDLLGRLSGGDGIGEWVDAPAAHIEDTLRLWPQFVAGEGHFAAVLEKDGGVPEGCAPAASAGADRKIPERELGDFIAFVKAELSDAAEAMLLDEGRLQRFGDRLYWVPEGMPAVRGLKVLRAGLQVGTLKKNRFEPAHALALWLAPDQAAHVWDLSSRDGSARRYLCGETFPADGEKGWYLICVDGFSLGWGKLAGGTMKNHYPRGLRNFGSV